MKESSAYLLNQGRYEVLIQLVRPIFDGAIMARSRAETKQDVTYFDGCGFGKYWVISFRLALLMPLKPTHNLLVRGSNPCGGTSYVVNAVTFYAS
jgi:hypothetical protein